MSVKTPKLYSATITTGTRKNKTIHSSGTEIRPRLTLAVPRRRRLRGAAVTSSFACPIDIRSAERRLDFVPGAVVRVAVRLIPVEVAERLGQVLLGVVQAE